MAEAVIQLPTGGTVTVNGSSFEVAEVLRMAGLATERNRPAAQRPPLRVGPGRKPGLRAGPLAYTRDLKTEGFFSTEKTLTEVQSALRTAGHIYTTNDISPALVRLVRKRELGRLKGKDGKWQYVDR